MDVAVYEVGLGGRWDATNVVDAGVAVVTNIGLDHVEFLGPTRADVAGGEGRHHQAGRHSGPRRAGSRPAAHLRARASPPSCGWPAGTTTAPATTWPSAAGSSTCARPAATYEDVWLDLHGSYQGDNFAAALAAAEAFFGAPLDDRLVREAAATVRSPGRLEIVGHDPLVVLDGAKNLEGAERAAAAVARGVRRPLADPGGRDAARERTPKPCCGPSAPAASRLVVACPPPSPRAQPAATLAAAAARLGVEAVAADSVADALASGVRPGRTRRPDPGHRLALRGRGGARRAGRSHLTAGTPSGLTGSPTAGSISLGAVAALAGPAPATLLRS